MNEGPFMVLLRMNPTVSPTNFIGPLTFPPSAPCGSHLFHYYIGWITATFGSHIAVPLHQVIA